MTFARARTQVLTRYMPGALFVHDSYGVCRVSSVDLESTDTVNHNALFDAVRDYLAQWDAPLRPGYVLDVSMDLRKFFVIGTPTRVRFEPYPDLLQCASCARVAPLRRIRDHRPGQCPVCSGAMRQVRFVESHTCGRLEPLTVPPCSVHGADDIALETSGRYRSLVWRCRACGDAFLSGVRNRTCMCEVTRRHTQEGFVSRLMRGSITSDSNLHVVHTVPFLNLPPDDVDVMLRAPEGRLLALARSCGFLDTPVNFALSGAGDAPPPELHSLLAALHAQGVSLDVLETAVAQAQTGQAAAAEALSELEQAYGMPREVLRARVPRRVVEFAALLDSGAARPLQAIRDDLARSGDEASAVALDEARAEADALGVSALYAMHAFPLAIAAVGYSRLNRTPNTCTVVPFGLPNEARVPLYVLSNTTEAVCVQVSPARVLSWLAQLNLMQAEEGIQPWARLHTAVPGVLQNRYQPDYDAPAAVAVRTLLHTLSHSLLQAITLSGYAPESVGEFLFPETLSVVLYANRFTDTKIGGLLTLVERSLSAWLAQARDIGRTCLQDPVCTDTGGACAACIHREHGCALGNRELSRAVLFGGGTVSLGTTSRVITRGFWEGQ